MDEKGRNVIIVIVALIIAIIFGYVIMYIKTPSVEEKPIENNTTVEDVDMDTLNFSHYLYDIDGNLENETSAKIMNSNVYLTINGNEHVLNNFGNPISVRVEHAITEEEFNMVYVLTTNKLYYIKDTEYESTANSKLRAAFTEVPVEDPVALAIVNEYDSKTDYRYPTVYLKTKDDSIYISRFGSDFTKYEEKE